MRPGPPIPEAASCGGGAGRDAALHFLQRPSRDPAPERWPQGLGWGLHPNFIGAGPAAAPVNGEPSGGAQPQEDRAANEVCVSAPFLILRIGKYVLDPFQSSPHLSQALTAQEVGPMLGRQTDGRRQGGTMTETQMEKAKRQYEQAKARLHATKAREMKQQRKRDTRRKVILGGALIELSERDQPARSMMRRLIGNLFREQDRKMFDPSEALPTNDESENRNDHSSRAENNQADRAAGVSRHG